MAIRTLSIIVGGSTGMGFQIAKTLAEKGHSLLLVARDEGRLKSAQDDLGKYGASVETMVVDLYNKEQVAQFIVRIEEESRSITHLVNSAGYFKPIGFLDHKESDYDTQLDLNKAFFFISQAVAKNMKESKQGAIVNIGSMWAHQAIHATPSSAYSMQKAGIHSLTQHMAMELAEYNIRVNAVAPAVVVTPIYKAFIDEDKIEGALQEGFSSFHPLGRVGQPTDVANAVDFLLSERASWITGEVLNVDGGVMAGRN